MDGNLFGRSLFLEQHADFGKQSTGLPQFRRCAAEHAPPVAALLCKRAAVLARRRIAQHFPADGGGGAIEYSGHGPNTQSLGFVACNRYPFFILELLVMLGFGHLFTLVDLRCCSSDLITPWALGRNDKEKCHAKRFLACRPGPDPGSMTAHLSVVRIAKRLQWIADQVRNDR